MGINCLYRTTTIFYYRDNRSHLVSNSRNSSMDRLLDQRQDVGTWDYWGVARGTSSWR